MTILVILHDAYGGHGGIAKFNRDFLEALAVSGQTQQIVALPRIIPEDPGIVPPKVDFRRDGLGPAWRQATAAWNAARARPRLVVCGHIRLLPIAYLAALRARAPLWLIIHGIDAWTPVRPLLTRFLLRRVDRVLSVSRYTQERFESWTSYPPDRVSLLPNCVDLSQFAPGPRDEDLAARYDLTGKRVLLTLGRLVSRERAKGMDEVLDVMPDLLRDHPDLVYMIAGDGPDMTRLQDKAARLGLAGHVRFPGRVSEAVKPHLYRLADVYVMPSRGEGFGIVFLEALASGLPCIGSSKDGSRDALRDGMLGQLVDPDDKEALRRAVERALATAKSVPPELAYFSADAYKQRVDDILRRHGSFA